MPGVVAVLTGDDMARRQDRSDACDVVDHRAGRHADGRAGALCAGARHGASRRRTGRVAIVAETLSAGRRMPRKRIDVDYDILPAETDGRAAYSRGRAAASRHRARQCLLSLGARRRAGCPRPSTALRMSSRSTSSTTGSTAPRIEPRAVIALPARGHDKLTLYVRRRCRITFAALVTEQLGISEAPMRAGRARCRRRLRLQGQALSGRDDRRLGGAATQRPVRWIASRSESFLSDYQAPRPHNPRRTGARRGRHFLGACACDTIANLGAYVSTFGAAIPSAIYSALLAGVYRTPAISVECDRRIHQHGADRCLSRRRPAGSLLRAGVARRRGARSSSGSTAPRSGGAISIPADGDALQDADRAELRLR